MSNETNNAPVWGYEQEIYINLGTTQAPDWLKFTGHTSWDEASEAKTFETAWLDRQNQLTFTIGRTTKITWEKDTVAGGELDAWLMENRNEIDIPCEIVKVYTWTGTPQARIADKASFLFTPNPIKNAGASNPMAAGGTLNMESDGWIEGTWDAESDSFTAAVEDH